MGVRLVYFNKPLNNTDSNKKLLEDHNDLINRDIQDQHPIYAISGLNEVLTAVETLLTEQTAEHEYLTGKLHESENRVETLNILLNAIKEKVDQFTDWKQDTIDAFQEAIETLNAPQILDVVDNNAIDLEYDASNKKLEAKLRIVTNNTLYSIRNRSHTVNRLYVTRNGLYVPNDTLLDSKSIYWENEQSTDTHAQLVENGYWFSHKSTSNEDVYETTRLDYWSVDKTTNNIIFKYNETITDLYHGFVSNTLYTDFTIEAAFYKIEHLQTGGENPPCGIGVTLYTNEDNGNFMPYDIIRRPSSTGWPGYYSGHLQIVKRWRTLSSSVVTTLQDNVGWHNWDETNPDIIKVTVSDCIIKNVTYNNRSFNCNVNIGRPMHIGFGICGLTGVIIKNLKITVPEEKTVQEEQGIVTVDNFRPHIKLNPLTTNALKITNEGLFSPGISTEANNAIIKKSDGGYFVQDTKISDKFGNDIAWDGVKTLYSRTKDFKAVEQESHGFIIGDFICYSDEYSKYFKAIAEDSYKINVVGMVTRIVDANNFEYMWSGYFATDIFNSSHNFVQGLPLYLSEETAGKTTQTQPNVSKSLGYPIENTGIIISLERGIQYNNEAKIGEIKQSTNTYNVRTDGFIRIVEGVQYKISLVGNVVNAVSKSFKENYMIVNEQLQTLSFKNVSDLKMIMMTPEGIELFIKAF